MRIEIDIPDCELGEWKVESFEVTKRQADFFNMRAAFSFSERGRYIEAGNYKRLIRSGQVIMSNTPNEIDDFLHFIYAVEEYGGYILINGLGLGVVLKKILEFNNVKSITVIEKEKDVIELVGKYFKDKRVNIIHADALEWKPLRGKKYDVVWHDIWDNISEDNLNDMTLLHRRYGKKCKWQGSWARELIR